MYKQLKFNNIKEFTWSRIAKEFSLISGEKVDFTESVGTVTFGRDEIDVRWSYDEAARSLSIVCTRKPDNISYDVVYNRLKEIVESKIVAL